MALLSLNWDGMGVPDRHGGWLAPGFVQQFPVLFTWLSHRICIHSVVLVEPHKCLVSTVVYVAVTGRKRTLFLIGLILIRSPASILWNFRPEFGTLLADRYMCGSHR